MIASPPLRDRLIPWYFVMFFIAIVIIDGGIALLAVATRTGAVTEHSYEQGLAYNKVVDAEERQKALGWSGEITFRAPMLSFTLHDARHGIVTLDRAVAHCTRPVQEGMDFDVLLAQAEPGVWRTNVAFPAPGLWEVRVFAARGTVKFQQSRRIIVK